MRDDARVVLRVSAARVTCHVEHSQIRKRTKVVDRLHDVCDEVVPHREALEVGECIETLQLLNAIVEE